MRAKKILSLLLVVAVLATAFVPPLLDHNGWAVWVSAAVACLLAIVLLWRLVAGFASMSRQFDRQIETLESDRDALQRRVADSEGALGQAKRECDSRLRACEQEKAAMAKQLADEKQQSAVRQGQIEEVQIAVARLNHENAELAAKGAEAITRRQSLQNQHFELEETAKEIKAAHAVTADLHRRSLADLGKLRSDLKQIQAERDSAQAQIPRLESRIETLTMEQTNTGLRETKWKAEAAEWKARAEDLERKLRELAANTAPQQELAARLAEIERLRQQSDSLTRQRDLALERSKFLEQEKETLGARLAQLTRQSESLDVVVSQLQDECRNAHQEPRNEMASHFVWKVNHFNPREVILNFLNEGAEVDLVGASTEPELPCEIPGERRLKRGGEGHVRVFAARPLPSEFVLKVRYTIYPQVAALKIRPLDTAKIERL